MTHQAADVAGAAHRAAGVGVLDYAALELADQAANVEPLVGIAALAGIRRLHVGVDVARAVGAVDDPDKVARQAADVRLRGMADHLAGGIGLLDARWAVSVADQASDPQGSGVRIAFDRP